MYLMDTVATAAAVTADIATAYPTHDNILRVYGDIAGKLKGAPRFLLDAKATRTAVEINLGRPKVILDAMQNLRIPYTTMWFEWEDRDRKRLKDAFHQELNYRELRPDPGRIGCLVEAAPDGRSGTLTWLWTTPKKDEPETENFANVGAVATYFDLDERQPFDPDRAEGLRRGNLFPLWHDNPVQLAALAEIWRYARFAPSEWGERFIAINEDPDLMRALAYGDVVGEWIMAICVLLLLTASRPIVDYREVDQRRLNKRREKRGEAPLFDHTVVSLHLSDRAARLQPRQPLSYLRKSPRIHIVSAYLARRGDKHWVVSPYWRGEGETISRHVHVRG
jgi:hypothetical protein